MRSHHTPRRNRTNALLAESVSLRCGRGAWSRDVNVLTSRPQRVSLHEARPDKGYDVGADPAQAQLGVPRRPRFGKVYELAIRMRRAQNSFSHTRVVTILPRYVLINHSHVDLEVTQSGMERLAGRFAPGDCWVHLPKQEQDEKAPTPIVWHWPNGKLQRRMLRLRVAGGGWLPSSGIDLGDSPGECMVKCRPAPPPDDDEDDGANDAGDAAAATGAAATNSAVRPKSPSGASSGAHSSGSARKR